VIDPERAALLCRSGPSLAHTARLAARLGEDPAPRQ
jgi:hypothetical protein